MATTRNSAGINTGSRGSKNVNPLYKAASSFTNYVGNVAREVRDVPTAIGTVLKNRQTGVNAKMNEFRFDGSGSGDIKNLKSQIKEIGKTIVTGKKGTTSQKSTIVEAYKPNKSATFFTQLAVQRNNKKKK